jgi:hypothetical protein
MLRGRGLVIRPAGWPLYCHAHRAHAGMNHGRHVTTDDFAIHDHVSEMQPSSGRGNAHRRLPFLLRL